MLRILVGLMLVGVSGPAWREPSLIAELEVTATQYHENPVRLDTVRESRTQAAGAKPEVDAQQARALLDSIWAGSS
jgi:hypothetical protein